MNFFEFIGLVTTVVVLWIGINLLSIKACSKGDCEDEEGDIIVGMFFAQVIIVSLLFVFMSMFLGHPESFGYEKVQVEQEVQE